MRRVLAVGAHPDDVEFGCGGTLAAHRDAGDDVGILVLTGGQNGRGANQQRVREQEAAAAVLDVDLFWGHLTDCAVASDVATVGIVEHVLETTRADVVYVHTPDDSHQDHRALTYATLAAARTRCRVLYYGSPSSLRFHPTMFVDIADHLELKITSVRCHQSQVAGSAMLDPEVVRAAARFFGAQAKIGYAEGFLPARFVWDLQPARPGTLDVIQPPAEAPAEAPQPEAPAANASAR